MLTKFQARVVRIMAANRTETSYFAGGAVLNERTVRLSDDLDVFTDTDEIIPDIAALDMKALQEAGFDVTINLEIHGCTEATVRDGERETVVQWMSESRMRFFPLQPDPLWGMRLHKSDLAVNKVLAASTRRQARDVLDLALIGQNYCPLGPLFLAAAVKIDALSPMALMDNARQRTVSAPNFELDSLCRRSGIKNWNASAVKGSVLGGLDMAEEFLFGLPDAMLGGLPANESGIPVDQALAMTSLRLLTDGGGRFPEFPDSAPDFIDDPQ